MKSLRAQTGAGLRIAAAALAIATLGGCIVESRPDVPVNPDSSVEYLRATKALLIELPESEQKWVEEHNPFSGLVALEESLAKHGDEAWSRARRVESIYWDHPSQWIEGWSPAMKLYAWTTWRCSVASDLLEAEEDLGMGQISVRTEPYEYLIYTIIKHMSQTQRGRWELEKFAHLDGALAQYYWLLLHDPDSVH